MDRAPGQLAPPPHQQDFSPLKGLRRHTNDIKQPCPPAAFDRIGSLGDADTLTKYRPKNRAHDLYLALFAFFQTHHR
ncbi:hypothetical protein [Janthinobacterium lividum]|uniref:hypothetical protein n=1 Tax=Janthinobacterium lividum TaxID=29581 RepID=UPI00147B59DC|nr:hypothetical protein [Janthinobacterium lividum]